MKTPDAAAICKNAALQKRSEATFFFEKGSIGPIRHSFFSSAHENTFVATEFRVSEALDDTVKTLRIRCFCRRPNRN
jgi:hypothetical protein